MKRFILGLSAVAGLCVVAGNAEAAPPVEAFASLPVASTVRLSPDGKHFALIQPVQGLPSAVIYSTVAKPGDLPVVFNIASMRATYVQWANSDRLLIQFAENGRMPGLGDIAQWSRVVSISPDGADHKVLMSGSRVGVINFSSGVEDLSVDDPNAAYMPAADWNNSWEAGTHIKSDMFNINLYHADITTETADIVEHGTAHTRGWTMDGHGHAVARLDEVNYKDTIFAKHGSSWDQIATLDAKSGWEGGIEGLSLDGSSLIIGMRKGENLTALYPMSLKDGTIGTAIYQNPNYDVDRAILNDMGRVIGASFTGDHSESVYFDPALDHLQKVMEKAFPGLAVTLVSWSSDYNAAIVHVSGAQSPPTYYFYDAQNHHAFMIAETYPSLQPADLGVVKNYDYTSPDGLTIHGYLTLPPGSSGKDLPLVVMPHGGPDARDENNFDWWTQFMASRGYAVYQPNFRGSSGYGDKFESAGFGQWGRKMQDDITNGVKKLIADGIAAPKRICIVGASYGGYAALAGATFTPDLYACAVSYAGVSDLPEMLGREGRDSTPEVVSFWQKRMGSQFTDEAQLIAASPARNADKVKIPMLLIASELDTTVPINQSETENDKLKAAGKDVQFIRIDGEDHYLTLQSTRITLLQEIDKFLAAHIGK